MVWKPSDVPEAKESRDICGPGEMWLFKKLIKELEEGQWRA